MGIDAKIYLEPHANPRKVFDVIQKVMGVEFKYSCFNQASFDIKLPSSEDNSWHLKPVKNDNSIENKDIDYLTFDFKDLCNSQYHCLYHLYLEDDEYAINNEKCINPKSMAVWLAIGKRLVDFFGGKMLYADSLDYESKDSWYVNHKKTKFGPNKKQQEFDANRRWYQYHNALNSEQILTAKEIKDMIPLSGYGLDERTELLVGYLEKYEIAQELHNGLKNKTLKNKKLKV